MNATTKGIIVGAVGIVLFVTALVILLVFPGYYHQIMNKKLRIIPSNEERYNSWKEVPSFIRHTFYMFNYTNVNEVINHGAKPRVQELGPYVFRQRRKKFNITWYKQNGTVSAYERQSWYFLPEESNGSLTDLVTTLNVPAVSAVYMLRKSPAFMHRIMALLLDVFGQHVFTTHTVGELLFDGYSTLFLKFLKSLKMTPRDAFGWMYQKNNSNGGLYTIYTGETSSSLIGKIDLWKGANTVPLWKGECKFINGTTGELWPPLKEGQKYVDLFLYNFARSFRIDYDTEKTESGITAFNYEFARRVFANSSENPYNRCFETGDSIPTGLLNLSTVFFGTPLFLSAPHFYLGDPELVKAVDGLKPSKERHSSHFLIEPITGVSLNTKVGLQLNIFLQPDSEIEPFCYVKPAYYPMIWFNEANELDSNQLAQIRYYTVTIPCSVRYTSIAVICISCLMLIGIGPATVRFWRKRRMYYGLLSSEDSAKSNGKDHEPLIADGNEL